MHKISVDRLLERLALHVREQQALHAQCIQLCDCIDNPAASFLAQQVAESKESQVCTLMGIATGLKDALQWTRSPDALPRVDGREVGSPWTRQRLDRLIDEERRLRRESHKLAALYGDINTGLDALLLDVLAFESHKHERLLRFVRRLVPAPARLTAARTAPVRWRWSALPAPRDRYS